MKYKASRNQRLLVELCLMQMASITFNSEITKKKKNKSNNHGINSISIIPPAYFKKNTVTSKDQENEEVLVSKKTTPAAINKETIIDQTFTKQIKEEKTKIEISIDRSNKKSAFSIASIKKKKELLKIINDNKPDEVEKPKNSFTEKEFQSAWSEFTKKIDGEGKYNLLSHLTMSKPLLEGTSINLVYPNHTIKTEVERAQHDILSFIKDKLQNYDINLAITVNETAEKKYAYTPIEKYEKLIEKNPLLDTLRKELGLEL